MSKIRSNSLRKVTTNGRLTAVKRINPPKPHIPSEEVLEGYYYDAPDIGRQFTFCHCSGRKARLTSVVCKIVKRENDSITFQTENTIYKLERIR